MFRVIFFILIFLFVFNAKSHSKIDSLEKVAKEHLNDTISAYNYFIIARTYYIEGDYSKSSIYIEKSLEQAQKLNYASGIIKYYFLKTKIHTNQSEYELAMQYAIEGHKVSEKYNRPSFVADFYVMMGSILNYQKNDAKAITFYDKAIQISKKIDDFINLDICYNNIGNIYFRMQKYDSALFYYSQSLLVAQQLEDSVSIAGCLANIGTVFFDKKDFENALKNFKEALKIYKKYEVYNEIASMVYNIASIYTNTGEYKESNKLTQEAIEIWKALNHKHHFVEAYTNLSKNYSKMGDFKNAYISNMYALAYSDSLYNSSVSEQTAELEAKYDNQRKENQIILLNKEKEKQQFIIYAFIVGVSLLTLLIYFILKGYREKQRANKLIVLQKEKVEHQNKLLADKNHEITQSIQYAQKIQSAIIPSEEIFRQTIPNSFILFKPRDIVSGDFYWISDRSNYLFYATADCTGHGVPGGFMSMLGTALLNEIIDERKIEDCGEVLNIMREKIIHALKQAGENHTSDGMDMVLVRINKETLQMEYAAANNSFYVVKRHETQDMRQEVSYLTSQISHLEELPCDKMPVGVYLKEVIPFKTFTYQLSKGDTIYTFTDGYADQFGGEKGKKYTYKRLREKLIAISNEPLEMQKMNLDNEFENWKANFEQVDDVCLIGIRI